MAAKFRSLARVTSWSSETAINAGSRLFIDISLMSDRVCAQLSIICKIWS